MFVLMCIRTYIYIYIHVCVYCTYVYVYIYIYTYTYVCICMCIYIYIHTHVNIYIYIYTYIIFPHHPLTSFPRDFLTTILPTEDFGSRVEGRFEQGVVCDSRALSHSLALFLLGSYFGGTTVKRRLRNNYDYANVSSAAPRLEELLLCIVTNKQHYYIS